MSQAAPNPSLPLMARTKASLKSPNDLWAVGILKVMVHVDAVAKIPASWRNSRDGGSPNPNGGMRSVPVKNTKISSSVQVVVTSIQNIKRAE